MDSVECKLGNLVIGRNRSLSSSICLQLSALADTVYRLKQPAIDPTASFTGLVRFLELSKNAALIGFFAISRLAFVSHLHDSNS